MINLTKEKKKRTNWKNRFDQLGIVYDDLMKQNKILRSMIETMKIEVEKLNDFKSAFGMLFKDFISDAINDNEDTIREWARDEADDMIDELSIIR